MKKKFFSYVGFSIFLSIFLVIIFSIASFISGSILTFLGLKYISVKSLLLFFLVYFILAMPIDLICEAFLKILKGFDSIDEPLILLFEGLISILTNTTVICIADLLVKGVTVSFTSKLLAAIIMFALGKFVEFKLKELNKRLDNYEKIIKENEQRQMENAIDEMENTISKEFINESDIISKIEETDNVNK